MAAEKLTLKAVSEKMSGIDVAILSTHGQGEEIANRPMSKRDIRSGVSRSRAAHSLPSLPDTYRPQSSFAGDQTRKHGDISREQFTKWPRPRVYARGPFRATRLIAQAE
jgi:hypothetical protein